MASGKARLAFRQRIHRIEFELLHDQKPLRAQEVADALLDLARPLGPDAEAQAQALCHLAQLGTQDRVARGAYIAEYGCGGTQRFATENGVVLYMIEAETFPGHVNNLYLIDARQSGHSLRTPEDLILFDAGSQGDTSRRDLDTARAVLARVYEEPGLLDRVRHVLISHGHIDHFGGVGDWQGRGARVYAHPFDMRVLTRFDERLLETSVYLRDFLEHVGCTPAETERLVGMNSASKRTFASIRIDGELHDGREFHGFRVHHVPGHCPGQVMLQVDSALLTADHLLARITPNQSPERITPWTGLDHYLLSLDRTLKIIADARIDIGLGGHEDPMPDPAARVRETQAFHRARLAKVLELCSEGRTIAALTRALFGEPAGYGQLLALGETAAHVEYLARRGHLELENIEALLREPNPALRYKTAPALRPPA